MVVTIILTVKLIRLEMLFTTKLVALTVSLWWTTSVRLSYLRWQPIRSTDTRIRVWKTWWSLSLIPKHPWQRYSTSIYKHNDDIEINIYFTTFVGYQPKLKYAPDPSMPDSKIDDIAINLKEFLTALDSRGISHPSEKSIRKNLRANNHCSTHHKQYFLKQHLGSMPLITKAKVAQ